MPTRQTSKGEVQDPTAAGERGVARHAQRERRRVSGDTAYGAEPNGHGSSAVDRAFDADLTTRSETRRMKPCGNLPQSGAKHWQEDQVTGNAQYLCPHPVSERELVCLTAQRGQPVRRRDNLHASFTLDPR